MSEWHRNKTAIFGNGVFAAGSEVKNRRLLTRPNFAITELASHALLDDSRTDRLVEPLNAQGTATSAKDHRLAMIIKCSTCNIWMVLDECDKCTAELWGRHARRVVRGRSQMPRQRNSFRALSREVAQFHMEQQSSCSS